MPKISCCGDDNFVKEIVMIFTVELSGMMNRYRLQSDGGWRRLHKGFSLTESDFRTSDPSEVMRRTPYGCEIVIEKIEYKVSPTSGNVGEILGGKSMIFRRDFPDVPAIDQLRAVLAGGDDSKANSLILNLNGAFELRQRPPFDIHRNDPTVILRHETFAPRNDYAGVDAAQDDQLVGELYRSSLAGWLNHLKYGQTQEYVGFSAGTTYEPILNEIEQVREHWVPAY